MSSKLVRKGLDLVNSETEGKKRKAPGRSGGEQFPKKRKTNARSKNEKPRGLKDLQLSSSKDSQGNEKDVNYIEKNLEYFRRTTWKISEETYNQIIVRQNKKKMEPSDEKDNEPETEGTGLFDD